MNFLLIIDHPSKRSFNHAVMRSFVDGISQNGHTADILDLNEDGFHPVMSEYELSLYSRGGYVDPKVAGYQQRLMAADHLVLIFPIWWMVMPAGLKGWLDKVLLPGFAFTHDQCPKPLLTHLQGATILTTTAVADDYHRKEYNNVVEWMLCKGTLQFCGIRDVTWLNFGDTGFASQEKHESWLDDVKNTACRF